MTWLILYHKKYVLCLKQLRVVKMKMMLTNTIFSCKAVRIYVTSEHSDVKQLSEFLNDAFSCLDIQMI